MGITAKNTYLHRKKTNTNNYKLQVVELVTSGTEATVSPLEHGASAMSVPDLLQPTNSIQLSDKHPDSLLSHKI